MDFSPFTKAQNDNGDFFAAATPCNPLGRFVLTHSAQNDKSFCHKKAPPKKTEQGFKPF